MGFGTNRVVGKQINKTGLSASQMKGMSTLHGICGVRKIENKEEMQNSIIDKLSSLKNNETQKSRLMADFNEDTKKNLISEKEPNKQSIGERTIEEKKLVKDIKDIEDTMNLKMKKPLSNLKKII